MMTKEQAQQLKRGDKLRALVGGIGDVGDEEKSFAAGDVLTVDRLDTYPAPHGLSITVYADNGVVNVFDEGDHGGAYPFAPANWPTVTLAISTQRIADTMVSAVEGNWMTRAWCAGIACLGPKTFGDLWYSEPGFYEDPTFLIEINEIIDESKAPRGDNIRQHICGPLCLANGLQIMAETNPSHFADFLSENGDAITADVFLQCVALGEVRYG